MSCLGSWTLKAPVPITLMAFRFLDPHTAPKPPWPAALPALLYGYVMGKSFKGILNDLNS